MLGAYFEEHYYNLSVTERKTIDHKCKPKKLFLEAYNYKPWFENEDWTVKEQWTDEEKSVDLSDMLPLEGDEKVKEGT